MDDAGMHKYLCWLDQIRGIGRKTRFRLIRAAEEGDLFSAEDPGEGARRLYEAPEPRLRFWCGEACPEKTEAEKAAGLLLRAQKQEPERIEEKLRDMGIAFSCILEEKFPERLRKIPDPPFGIYCRGEMPFPGDGDSAEQEPAAAVIGARLASGYGREQARRFSRRLASNGIAIISGMAKGIDGIAQKAALEAGGKSFAVLGCGVDQCYPEENRDLYERLLSEGGVLSEFPPGTPPDAKNFPQRNRIISGLSDLVLVIEARKRSGTLITVDMALEQGREVFALPGRVSDSLSDGCNRLIRQGANPATCPEDVLEFFYGIVEPETAREKKIARNLKKLRESAGPAGQEGEEHAEKEDDNEDRTAGSPASAAEPDPEERKAQSRKAGCGREETGVRTGSAGGGSGFPGEDRLSEDGRKTTPGTGADFTEKDRERGREEGHEGRGRRGGQKPEQAPRRKRKAWSPLEAAVLKALSPEDEIHLERLLEEIGVRTEEEEGRSAPAGLSLESVIPVLMRLKMDGVIEETTTGYYRKRGRWE